MKKFLELYIRTLKIALHYPLPYFGGWIFSLILLLVNNYSVFLIGDLVNTLSAGGDITRPILMMILILAIPITLEPLVFGLKSIVYTKSVREIMDRIYRHIMNLDYEFHINKETGSLISKLINSDNAPRIYLWLFEWFTIENVANVVIPLVLIGILSWKVMLVTILVVLIILPIQAKVTAFNMRHRTLLKNAEYKRNSYIIDGLTNYETVRIFGKVGSEENYLSESLNEAAKEMQHYQDTFRLIDFVARLASVFVFASGSYVLINEFKMGLINVGGVVVIVAYLIKISGSLMGIIYSFRELFKDFPLVEDVFKLLEEKRTIIEPKNPKKLKNPKGNIDFSNVTFEYRKGCNVIKNLNLTIKANQTVAFVGPSGGGKTSIARLLLRYYDPQEGSVMIDGVDIRKIGSNNVNLLIGVVPQEPILFNRSIKYNIGYCFSVKESEIDKYMDEIIDAAKQAQIHEFIISLPEGYNTIVGERGIKLSGGQKQRIAIARVLLKNPKIVIFDEATSMLDSESEKAIQKAFKKLSKDTTTIIIAHRLSTIIKADKIFVIDKGEIVEEGKHEELIMNKGVYNKLWNIQSGGFIKEK